MGIVIKQLNADLNNPWVNPYSHFKWLNDTIDDRGHTGDCFSYGNR